jgi:hypothetical protein
VEHHGRSTGAPTGPDDRGELRTPAQACLRGQHLRRRASRDPCAGDRRGSPGPRGCASAAGSRGSWTAGGCSAGTCACSRGTPTTRHRRCAPIGGRARGGSRRERLASRGPGTPGSWFLRAGVRTEHPAQRRTNGRNRPRTPTSIAEDGRLPEVGGIPTAHGPPTTAGARRDAPEGTASRRAGGGPVGHADRCRAVDGAVSVAVAPRRTSGSRRVGRPRRSPDRRTARSSARNA